jgi:hypothetical protein
MRSGDETKLKSLRNFTCEVEFFRAGAHRISGNSIQTAGDLGAKKLNPD